MLDLNFENNLAPESGYLLVSEPFMNEAYFQRSVVLICEHEPEGSFGFVLNNYLDLNIAELTKDLVNMDFKISIGGPIDVKNLYYIHTFGNLIPNSTQISDQLYLGGDYEKLVELLKVSPKPEKQVRFFLGYSGWGKDQLADEIKEKSWIVVKTNLQSHIMDTDKQNLWQECLQNLGGKYKMFAQIPTNPHNN